MSSQAVKAYRLVGAYTISAVSKAIEEIEIAATKKDELIRGLLLARKAELENALEVIKSDLETF